MGTVPTSRELQNAYMYGSGAAVAISASEFNDTYGRYAISAAARAFQTTLENDFGGDVSRMGAAGTFDLRVSQYITDIHSADYMDRALAFGDQSYRVRWQVYSVDGRQVM